MLKRQKMLKKMEAMFQPGQIPLVRDYLTEADFFVWKWTYVLA